MSAPGVVIVGAGQVSAVATRTLRRRGYDGSITILGDEPERPYQRPPLSKEFLTRPAESDPYLLPEEWTDAKDVEIRTGTRVTAVSSRDGAVLLQDGSSIRAAHVLLATGGRARRLPGADGDRILYLRSKTDAEILRDQLGAGVRLVVIGAGFIGAEVASSARELGAEVTVLEAEPRPLHRVLGGELATAYASLHRAAGVDLRLGVVVIGVEQRGDEVVIATESGDIRADVVLIGIGMVPNDEIATASGIAADRGILVDEYCRTSLENVYAAGDVAAHFHPLFGRTVRAEHFDNANRQGAVAANNMLGRTTVYNDPHWFWSDQFGKNLQYVGSASSADELIVRGALEDPEWSAFFVRDGLLRAAFSVDRGEDVMVARELIARQIPVAVGALKDPDTDLMELMEDL